MPCVLLSFERESILMWKGPKSEVDTPDGVEQDTSGEAVPPFRKELPEDGQELLEKTLTQEESDILAAAQNIDIREDEDSDEYEDETDTDRDVEAAYQSDNEQESIQEVEDDADVESSYYNEAGDDQDEGEDAGLVPQVAESQENIDTAVEEFESRWQEAISSSEVLVLDEDEADPDRVFELVKSHFGGAYGAPAQPRNKRNSNELVGKKALKKSSPRLDPSVLDRVPKDPSGLLEIDELAKLLAP